MGREKSEEARRAETTEKLFSINIRLCIYCFAKRNMYTGFIYLLPNVVIGFGLGLATVITGI